MIALQREEIFAEGDASVKRYVAKMRRPREWGTGLEALSAAYVYRRPVHVWEANGEHTELRPPYDHLGTGDVIHLLHNSRNHWDSALQATPSAASRASHRAVARADSPETQDGDSSVALAAALEESRRAAGVEAPPEVAEKQAQQRSAAAAAAEARLKKAETRGIGDAERLARLQRGTGRGVAAPKAANGEPPRT